MDVLSFSAIWELTVMYRNDHPKKVEQELKAQEEKEEGDKAEMPPDVPTPALPTSSAATQQAGPASATLKPPASAVDKESEEPPTPADPTAIPVDNSKGAEESSGIPPEKPARLLELFIEEALYTSPDLTIILQSLLSNREFSQCLVGILLRHLVTLLPDLGCRGSVYSHVVVRLFKLSFMAVTLYSEVNESVLLPHCNHILMQCLKLANHSKQPMGYYMLLRNLFRSIGGGRFERIFKAVLPMLSPMLDQLQKLIDSNEGSTRDLFVELTLTVPVRLSVLLPYLGYLMKPLRLALDSGPELIAQGLRTLELCVDNLTHDFLNPFLRPFLDDVLSALWKLLRPSPLISPSFSHQALRILGKLGGRSRSLINRPKLKWTNASPGSQAMLPLQFDGQYDQSVPLKPLVELALKSLQRGDKLYRQNAFSFLKSTSALFLQSKLAPGENEEVFALLIQGLFDCAKTPDCKEEASIFLVDYLSFVVTSELSGDGDGNISKQYLPLTSALLDALAETFATATGKDLDLVVERTGVFVTRLVHHSDIPSSRTMPVIRQLSSRLSSLCYEPSRNRKMGGLAGLQMLFNKLGEPVDSNSWLQHHELEMVRSLLFMLKDLGPEFSPSQVQEVKDFFKAILYQVQLPSADAPAEAMARVNYFVGLFMNELPSQSDTAREAGKMAIGIMAERLQVTVHELLKPHLSRLLLPIYNRPLRALAFHMQIGHIDALTYLLTLEQPLVEFGELPRGAQDNGTPNASSTPQSTAPTGESNATELQPTDGNTNQGTAVSPGQSQRPQPSRTPQLSVPFQMTRLLVEVIGIADAEDTALVQKANPIKSADLLAQLRIVCVKFLAAALDAPELATQRHAPTRSRILAVNFKLLYKPREDVVDVAYNCLKNVKALQSKLPKEMLQAGLRFVFVQVSIPPTDMICTGPFWLIWPMQESWMCPAWKVWLVFSNCSSITSKSKLARSCWSTTGRSRMIVQLWSAVQPTHHQSTTSWLSSLASSTSSTSCRTQPLVLSFETCANVLSRPKVVFCVTDPQSSPSLSPNTSIAILWKLLSFSLRKWPTNLPTLPRSKLSLPRGMRRLSVTISLRPPALGCHSISNPITRARSLEDHMRLYMLHKCSFFSAVVMRHGSESKLR